jgi:hypothetical protein
LDHQYTRIRGDAGNTAIDQAARAVREMMD